MRRHLLPLVALALLGVPASASAQPLADTVAVVSAAIRALDDHYRARVRALVTDVATIPETGDTVPVAMFSPEAVRGLQAAVPRLHVCTRGREGACGGMSGILELVAAPEFTSADSARILLAFETRQNVLVVRLWLERESEGWMPIRGETLADVHMDIGPHSPAPPPPPGTPQLRWPRALPIRRTGTVRVRPRDVRSSRSSGTASRITARVRRDFGDADDATWT